MRATPHWHSVRSVIRCPRTLCVALLLSLTSAVANAEGPTPAGSQAMPAAKAHAPTLQVEPAKANEPATTIGPLPVQGAPAPGAAPAPVPPDPLAADDTIPGVNASDAGFDGLKQLLQMLLVLGIVVGLIYLTLNFGLRRLMGLRGVPMGRSQLVQVVERIPLDPKRAMYVVRAGGEYLLVGGGEEGLSLITRLDGASVQAAMDAKKVVPAMSPFLQKLLTTRRSPEPQPPSAEVQGESKKV